MTSRRSSSSAASRDILAAEGQLLSQEARVKADVRLQPDGSPLLYSLFERLFITMVWINSTVFEFQPRG